MPEPTPFHIVVPDDLKNQGRSVALAWTGVRPLIHPEYSLNGDSIFDIAFVLNQLRKPERDR